VADAFFLPDGERLVPTVLTRGPWSPIHQHGGPPAAVMARAIELAASEPEALQLTRFTVDFVRPVPMEPLTVAVELMRDGRRARGYAAVLSAGGQAVARATALLVRTEQVAPPPVPEQEPLRPPPAEAEPFQWPFFRDPDGLWRALSAIGVALGNEPVIAELNQPASEISVTPEIDAAASLHRNRSG